MDWVPEKRLRYGLDEVATMLGVSRSTLYNRIRAGLLRVQRDGRRTFVLAREIERYVEGEQLAANPLEHFASLQKRR